MSQLFIEQIRPELTWRLRQEVLYPQQHLAEMKMDEDTNGIHFGAFLNSKLIGVVSLFQNDKDFQFRKFAVDPGLQKQGIGSTMLQYITDFAITEGGSRLWCNARLSAIKFYTRAGFTQTGNFFNRGGFDYEILQKALQ
ncbi:GNAT family N-acetyltransferase [Mucilaginibacter gynuensis]|uniref:GNAT family N-acetyltransferase n=1 Tax=Mucilaginibacter gynuensis TaxID=1302236 RepID=A0ABP8GZB8_9SPHI